MKSSVQRPDSCPTSTKTWENPSLSDPPIHPKKPLTFNSPSRQLPVKPSTLLLLALLLLLLTPASAATTYDCSDTTLFPNVNATASPTATPANYCVCSDGYYWKNGTATVNGVCLACTALARANKTGTHVGGNCSCNANYYFSLTVCRVNCTNITNTVAELSATRCSCDVGFAWATSLACVALDCAAVANTDGNNDAAMSGICTCNTETLPVWNQTFGYCQVDCDIDYATGYASQTTCKCQKYFVWDNTTQICKVNCLGIPGNNGTASTDNVDCVCNDTANQIWSPTLKVCRLDCTDDPNAAEGWLSGTSTTTCLCAEGYQWVSAVKLCQINCTGIVNSTKRRTDTDTCGCHASYNWTASTKTCDLNCDNVPNSDTSGPTAPGQCNCNNPFTYNNLTAKCVLDCTKVEFANQQIAANASGCVCEDGFIWNRTDNTCGINCSAVVNATRTRTAIDACECAAAFTWNSDLRTCDLDCTKVDNVDESVTEVPEGTCACNIPTSFNNLTAKCVLNCSLVPNGNGTVSATNCLCSPNFTWNRTDTTCWINCSAYTNTTGIRTAADACECHPSFNWSTTSKSCVLNCQSVENADPEAEHPAGTCICAVPYSFNNLTAECELNCSLVEGADVNATTHTETTCTCGALFKWEAGTKQCIPNCDVILKATGTVADSTDCVCAENWEWNATARNCTPICADLAHTNTTEGGEQVSYMECRCRLPFAWFSVVCGLECSLEPHRDPDAMVVQLGKCACKKPFVWEDKTEEWGYLGCNIDCTQLSYLSYIDPAGTQTAKDECPCQAGYRWNSTIINCDLDCSAFENTLYTENVTVCVCHPSYDWNNDTQTCELSCSAVNFSTGAKVGSACECVVGYAWNAAASNCTKAFSCFDRNFTNLTVSSPVLTCKCIKYFLWNATTLQCQIDCSTIVNADLQSTNPSTSQCACRAGTNWTVTTAGVRSCNPNCSNISQANALGNAPVGACACVAKFTWLPEELKCQLDCTKITGAEGTDSLTECGCTDERRVWNSTALACLIDCTLIDDSNTATVTLAATNCICKAGFVWDATALTCTWNCSSISFTRTVTTVLPEGTCSCLNFYTWNNDTKVCYFDCSRVFGASEPFTVVNGNRCQCRTNFTWNAFYSICTPICSRLINTTTLNTVNGRSCGCKVPASQKWAMTPTPGCHVVLTP